MRWTFTQTEWKRVNVLFSHWFASDPVSPGCGKILLPHTCVALYVTWKLCRITSLRSLVQEEGSDAFPFRFEIDLPGCVLCLEQQWAAGTEHKLISGKGERFLVKGSDAFPPHMRTPERFEIGHQCNYRAMKTYQRTTDCSGKSPHLVDFIKCQLVKRLTFL